jgi:hypothetical protein
LLLETGVGVEEASPHLIHVGQRFTITFGDATPSSALWSFPDIAKKVSRRKAGVDLKCTYVARKQDVTYPALATYDGWSDFSWQGIDKFGAGTGFGYYAIVTNGTTVTGRLADRHGRGIPRGGIQNPGGPTPDPGVLIYFEAKRHGVLTPLYASAPSIHGSPAHPFDVGYYGLLIKPGTYKVVAGDVFEHISCKTRTLHLTHSISNFNITCT